MTRNCPERATKQFSSNSLSLNTSKHFALKYKFLSAYEATDVVVDSNKWKQFPTNLIKWNTSKLFSSKSTLLSAHEAMHLIAYLDAWKRLKSSVIGSEIRGFSALLEQSALSWFVRVVIANRTDGKRCEPNETSLIYSLFLKIKSNVYIYSTFHDTRTIVLVLSDWLKTCSIAPIFQVA